MENNNDSPPVELSRLARLQSQVNMWKIIGEWKATTDPVKKGLLFYILQSMRAAMAASARSGDGGDEKWGEARVWKLEGFFFLIM